MDLSSRVFFVELVVRVSCIVSLVVTIWVEFITVDEVSNVVGSPQSVEDWLVYVVVVTEWDVYDLKCQADIRMKLWRNEHTRDG